MIRPPKLLKGDMIAIISPATTVLPQYIDGAARWISARGWIPVVMPSANGPANGSYAASEQQRLNDLTAALLNPDIKAILCARGGYGCIHLIDKIPETILRQNAKWIIGFSDVSALHAMFWHAGVMSIHAPMAKHLTNLPDDVHSRNLASILSSSVSPEIDVKVDDCSINGIAQGELRGGNLAVLDGLADTPFDMLKISEDDKKNGVILFMEDIAEPIYKVERILWRLHLCGTLSNVDGLIFGAYTEYQPDKNFPSMQDMIITRLHQWGINIPVAINFPTGHIDNNYPLIQGERVKLTIKDSHATLKKL